MFSLNKLSQFRNNTHYTIFYDEEESFASDNQSNSINICPDNDERKYNKVAFYFIKVKNWTKLDKKSGVSIKKKFTRAWEYFQNKMPNIPKFDGTSNSGNKVPVNCVTPTHKARNILGRTPIKLYSPFAIETPNDKSLWYHRSNVFWETNSPIKFGDLEHLENKKKRKYRTSRQLFPKLAGKRAYYNL